MFKRYQDTSNLSNGWVTGRYLLLICTAAINNRLSIARSYILFLYYFHQLRLWQVNTQIGDARFCEIARTYLQLDLNAILHQHLIFSPKWTSEFDFDGRNISEQSTTVWLHDQKFLRTKWKFIAGEENVHQREITWYWDPVKQVVRNQIFDSDGK